jgi:hypothetical protein
MRWTWLALAAPVLLAGCGSSPPTHFFTLTPVPGQQAAAAKGKPVQVRDVEIPASLDRLSMVLHGPGAQVQVLGQDRWSAPLKGLIRQALTQDLRSRLGDAAVVSPAAPEPPGGVQVLILNIQEFSANTAGLVTLDTDWSLGRGNPPKAVMHRHATLHVNAGSAQPDAVAEAMSRALGQLADQIAGAL